MKFTYLGHSCFILEIDGQNFLFDPFVTPNPLAAEIDIHSLKADYILVTHGHADHIADCVAIAKRTKAQVISNWEICQWLNTQGVENTIPMNTGGKKLFDFGFIKCVAAQHSSSLPDGSYGGNPMGFVIKAAKTIYYSGDTALTLDMQLIPQISPVQYCIFPIGDHFTMGYEDAARAAHMIQCREVIGVHYNTFPFIEIDLKKAISHFEKNGLQLQLPPIGGNIDL